MQKGSVYKKTFWLKFEISKIRCSVYFNEKSKKAIKADILIIPGLSEFIERYDFIAEKFAKENFRVAIIDLPGQGLSTRFGNPSTVIHVSDFELYFKAMNFLMKSLKFGLYRKTIFFGHSLGGLLILYYQIHSKKIDNFFIQPSMFIVMAPMMGLPISNLLAGLTVLINKFLIPLNLSNIGINTNLASIASFIGLAGKNVKNSVSKASDYWKKEENINYYGKETSEEALSYFEENKLLETEGPSWNWVSNAIFYCDKFFKKLTKKNINQPFLLFLADDEKVTDSSSQKKLVQKLSNVEEINLPSCRHDIIHEKEEVKVIFWKAIDNFVKKNLC